MPCKTDQAKHIGLLAILIDLALRIVFAQFFIAFNKISIFQQGPTIVFLLC